MIALISIRKCPRRPRQGGSMYNILNLELVILCHVKISAVKKAYWRNKNIKVIKKTEII